MSDAIKDHLKFLYGGETAHQVLPSVRRLIEEHPEYDTAAERTSLPLSERDALLITYGDQVREADRPPLQTLGDFLDQHLRGVVNGVHILPFYPYSSDDGFSVKDFYAVDPALGAWDDVKRIGRRFNLMVDAVFNHMSAQSEWFRKFLQGDPKYKNFFVTVDGDPDLSGVVRPRALPLLTKFDTTHGAKKVWTTFSADQVDVDVRNPEVLVTLLDILLAYVAHGARFIRLDAIAYLWKEAGTPCIHLPQTHRIIQLMRSVLDEVAPEVMLITETNVPHKDNVSYFGDGRNEAQLVYNFALPPLVLHAMLSGRADHLIEWAKSLELPSRQVTYFNFLASHDGIGVNPARGILSEEDIEALGKRALAHGGYIGYKHLSDGSKSPYELNINYFDALSDPNDPRESMQTRVDRFLAAQAIMLAMIGLPAVYFHSMFGSRNDRAAAEASGIPRRINRQKLMREELERELADAGSLRAKVFAGNSRLLRARCSRPAFHPSGEQTVLDVDPRVFALERIAPGGGDRVICLHNVSPEAVRVSVPVSGWKAGHSWRDLISEKAHRAAAEGRLDLELPPYGVIWTHE